MSTIKLCQLFSLEMSNGAILRGQNYFIKQDYTYAGQRYQFVPFEVSGSTSSVGGDNEPFSLIVPREEIILRLLEGGDGNRQSELTCTTLWLTQSDSVLPGPLSEFFVGVGAGHNETTVELRFRSAMDSVGSSFPQRRLTAENVGILPLSSEIALSR